MSCSLESEFLALENTDDHLLPENSCLWVTLKHFVDGDHVVFGINVHIETFVIPGSVGIINLEVTLFGGRWRLLVGILGIGEENGETHGCGHSKEEMHTRLIDA